MEKEVALLSGITPIADEDWEAWRGEPQPPVFALKRECDTFNSDVRCPATPAHASAIASLHAAHTGSL